jgi:hypothetical protein
VSSSEAHAQRRAEVEHGRLGAERAQGLRRIARIGERGNVEGEAELAAPPAVVSRQVKLEGEIGEQEHAAVEAAARAMPFRSPLISTTSALSIATSVPLPMAMPTSAAASAGASLIPSPAIATMRPVSRSRCTTSAFRAGRTSASNSSMPSFRAAPRSRRAW